MDTEKLIERIKDLESAGFKFETDTIHGPRFVRYNPGNTYNCKINKTLYTSTTYTTAYSIPSISTISLNDVATADDEKFKEIYRVPLYL